MLKELHPRSLVTITYFNKDKKLKVGYGVIISRDTILTAAHHIYDRKAGCEYEDFKIYFEKDGDATKEYL